MVTRRHLWVPDGAAAGDLLTLEDDGAGNLRAALVDTATFGADELLGRDGTGALEGVGRDTYLSSGLLFKGLGQWHAAVLSPSVGVVEDMPAWLLSGTSNEAIGATFELPPGTYDMKAWVANTTTNANTARLRFDYGIVASGEDAGAARTVGPNSDVALPTTVGQITVETLGQITVAAGSIVLATVFRLGGTDSGSDDAAFFGLDPVAV